MHIYFSTSIHLLSHLQDLSKEILFETSEDHLTPSIFNLFVTYNYSHRTYTLSHLYVNHSLSSLFSLNHSLSSSDRQTDRQKDRHTDR